MERNQILNIFEQTGAIMRGHFLLTSGLHTDTYVQCAKVLMYPSIAKNICAMLAHKIREQVGLNKRLDMVVSPAMGGVVLGYEVASQLGIPAIFCERKDGVFTLRRGFEIVAEQNILIVEDVVTTGKSSLETIECIKSHGGNVIGEACLINRNGSRNPLPVPLVSLAELEIKTYKSNELPANLVNIPAIKPGSR